MSKATLAAVVAVVAVGWAGSGSAATRIWVSAAKGVDQPGCASPASPCRSFQYAHDAIAAGGEIDVLDPGGYGAVTITKAVSIVNDGVGTAGAQTSSGAAITVNAGAGDAVVLRGLNLDGAHFAGSDGVVFNFGRSLTVVGCAIGHFANNGVLISNQGAFSALISHTLITDLGPGSSGFEGAVAFLPFMQLGSQGTIAVDHLTVSGAVSGVAIIGHNVAVTVTDSQVTNSQNGVAVAGDATTTVVVDSSTLSLNANDGVGLEGGRVHLSRNVISQNLNGVLIAGGTAFSGGNNVLSENNHDLTGGALNAEPSQ